MQAAIRDLTGDVQAIDSSLRILDRTLQMNQAEVADQMVASGMVKNVDAISVYIPLDGRICLRHRLPGTPEELAKGAAVVTGKITFITESINPAMKGLYKAKISAGKSIIEITRHLALAERKSTELGLQIARLEGKIEYEQIKEESYEPALVNVQKESLAGDISPMLHTAAFADIRAAWNALRANAIDGKTYEKIKSRMQAASLLYGQQQMEPW